MHRRGAGDHDQDQGDANLLSGVPDKTLDATGTADLSSLNLSTSIGLPEFLITLNGAQGSPGAVTVKLTWTGTDDPSCVLPGILANFGDPHFDSYDNFVDQGNFTRGLDSILPHWWLSDTVHTFPYSDGSHVHSWCLHGDGICNYSLGNMIGALLGSYPHYHYMDKYTASAAKWAYGVWKSMS